MTQAATPRQDHTTLSPVENDLLYEVVDGHIVEKAPVGSYEIVLGSFLNTCLDGFARASNCGPPKLSPTGRSEALAPGQPLTLSRHPSSAACPGCAKPRHALLRAA